MNEIVKSDYDENVVQTVRASIYPGAKVETIKMIMDYCRHAKLDIMLKPVHIVPMWIVDKETGKGEMRDVLMPGINLYRIQASRSGCAGISEPEFGEEITECLGGVDVTYPKWCKVTVKRVIGNKEVEFTAKEYWKENYANAGKDKATGKMKEEPNAMWLKRKYGQIAKCAEAQALRKGFPEIGAMPTAEEMEGKTLDHQEYEYLKELRPDKGVNGLKQKLGMIEVKPLEAQGQYDVETGEVTEKEADPLDMDTLTFQIESALTIKDITAIKDKARQLPDDKKAILRVLFFEAEQRIAGEKNNF